jgi:hypothetical protein
MTIPRATRQYALPAEPLTPGLRALESRDIEAACVLLNAFLTRCVTTLLHTNDRTQTCINCMYRIQLEPSYTTLSPPWIYTCSYKLAPQFSENEFAHNLLPRPGIIDTFVVEDPASPGCLSGLVSFYHVHSKIAGALITLADRPF